MRKAGNLQQSISTWQLLRLCLQEKLEGDFSSSAVVKNLLAMQGTQV